MKERRPVRVLYVCSGNICRSPLAHGVTEHLLRANGEGTLLEVESRGTTGYHVGEQVDSRMRETARRRGVTLSHRAQQMGAGDFDYYDLILAMDNSNYRDLMRMTSDSSHHDKIRMFREFDSEGSSDDEVPDPWYGGMRGFERVYEIVDRTCRGIIAAYRDGEGVKDVS